MRQNQNINTNSTSNSLLKNNDIIIAKVVIERFPSRNEMISLLDAFLKERNYQKDYELDTKDSVLIVMFKQYEVAVEFCKYINIAKIDKKIYSKLKAYAVLEEIKKYKPTTNNKKNTSMRNSLFNFHQSKNSCHLHKSSSCPMMEKKRIYMVKNTYSSVIAATPFTEQYEKIKEERKLNKAKWLQGKNFNTHIGRASIGKLGFIDNYVVRDSSVPSYAFHSKLRASNKAIWVNPKGFSP